MTFVLVPPHTPDILVEMSDFTPPSTHDNSSATPSFLSWLRSKGVERITVHGVRDLSGHRRVSDTRRTLAAFGIHVDWHTDTVAVSDLIARFPNA